MLGACWQDSLGCAVYLLFFVSSVLFRETWMSSYEVVLVLFMEGDGGISSLMR